MSKHNELTGSSGTKIDWELKIGHGWQIVTSSMWSIWISTTMCFRVCIDGCSMSLGLTLCGPQTRMEWEIRILMILVNIPLTKYVRSSKDLTTPEQLLWNLIIMISDIHPYFGKWAKIDDRQSIRISVVPARLSLKAIGKARLFTASAFQNWSLSRAHRLWPAQARPRPVGNLSGDFHAQKKKKSSHQF